MFEPVSERSVHNAINNGIHSAVTVAHEDREHVKAPGSDTRGVNGQQHTDAVRTPGDKESNDNYQKNTGKSELFGLRILFLFLCCGEIFSVFVGFLGAVEYQDVTHCHNTERDPETAADHKDGVRWRQSPVTEAERLNGDIGVGCPAEQRGQGNHEG